MNSPDSADEVARLASLAGGTASTPAVPSAGVECRTTSSASQVFVPGLNAAVSPESCLRVPKSMAFQFVKVFPMTALLRKLLSDEAGMILSAEMIIILTVSVLGMIVGLVNLQNALLGEFADLSLAFQSLNQSYSTPSFRGCMKFWGRTSWYAGSSFIDIFDGCVSNGGNGYAGSEIVSGTGYYGGGYYGGGGYVVPGDAGPMIANPNNSASSSGSGSSTITPPNQSTAPGGAGTVCPPSSVQPIPQGTPIEAPCSTCQ